MKREFGLDQKSIFGVKIRRDENMTKKKNLRNINLQELLWDSKNTANIDIYMGVFADIHEEFDGDPAREIKFLRDLEKQTKSAADYFFDGVLTPGSLTGLGKDSFLGEYCQIRVDARTLVLEANSHAESRFGIEISKTLEENGIESFDHAGFEDQFKLLIKQGGIDGEFEILQVWLSKEDRNTTVAILPFFTENAGELEFLLIFMDSSNLMHAAEMMAQKFNFRDSETDITKAIFAGKTLRETAEDRNRSYRTVRNQFQQVLEKSGCKSQTSFIQLGNDLAHLIKNNQKRDFRFSPKGIQTLEIPRAKGRTVEVKICGNPSGVPILGIHEATGHAISEEMVAYFESNNYLYLSVARPGFGFSSPVPEGADRNTCIANDLVAVLDCMEIQSCSVLAWLTSARACFRLLEHRPDRFHCGVVVGGTLPRSYQRDKTLTSKWTRALVSVATASPSLLRLLILGLRNSMMHSPRPSDYFSKLYKSDPDQEFFKDDSVGVFLRESTRHNSISGGFDAAVPDLYDALTPWGEDTSNIKVPILVIHGALDMNSPASEVQDFIKSYPNCLSYQEIEAAGSVVFFSHFKEVMGYYSKFTGNIEKTLKPKVGKVK